MTKTVIANAAKQSIFSVCLISGLLRKPLPARNDESKLTLLNIQIFNTQGIRNNKVTARFYHITHKCGEN